LERNLAMIPARSPGPRGVSAPAMTARDVIGMLRRRLWLIVMITGLFTVLGVVLWMVLLMFNPKYTSTGIIQVRMPVREDILSSVALIPRADIINLETKRKARQLTSDSFLLSLLVDPKVSVYDTDWYDKYGKDPINRLESLKSSFKAVALREEGLIQVSMTASVPKDAQAILRVAMEQFQYEIKDVTDTTLGNELTSLKEQQLEISSKISNRRGQLNTIHQGMNVPGWQSGNSLILQELMILGQERLRLHAALLEVSGLSDWLDEELVDNSFSSTVLNAVNNDGMVQTFRNQISTYEVERERLMQKFGQDHDQVKSIVSSLEGLRVQLAGLEEKLQKQFAIEERMELNRRYQEYSKSLAGLELDIQSASKRQADVEQKLADYRALTQINF